MVETKSLKIIFKICLFFFVKREVPFDMNFYVEYIIDSQPYVPYEVQVSAQNIRGEGPRSNISIVYSAEGSTLFKFNQNRKNFFNLTFF